MQGLTGKTALVTGASSGIGQATAIQLASHGCHLLLQFCDNEKGIESTRKQVLAHGVECSVYQCDFQHPDLIEQLCDQTWGCKNRIDLLVNNAGGDVLTTARKAWTFDQKLDFLWTVDVKSCLAISRNIGSRMKLLETDSKPVIINIGWDQAESGQSGESGEIFATTKGAIMAFTKSLAKSLAPQVRVNCVAPGWIQTSWGASTSEYWDQRAKNESLLKRWGTPADVANTICLLASPAVEFVNGQTIPVNGGIRFGCE